ncbi:MAG TPA: hypothetical protein VIQ81_09400 [Gammaproteobacteria bacterium]
MKFIKTILQLLCASWLMLGAGALQAETGLNHFDNMTKSIVAVDQEKGLITIADKTFKFDGKTTITNYKGEKVAADHLKKGHFVTIKLNTGQRYLNYPLLSHIRIETGDGDQ